MQKLAEPLPEARPAATEMAFPIVVALSFAHLLNDMMQSLLPAIYPIIKDAYALDFAHIGLITLAFQLTASLFQPLVGHITDRRPQPFSLVVGMGFTLVGLIAVAYAGSYAALLVGAMMIGTGSSIFHPESTRIARLASGLRHGFAQSVFQVGGQTGQALGPLLAAFIVVPLGQASLAWFALVALFAMGLLYWVGGWYRLNALPPVAHRADAAPARSKAMTPGVALAVAILIALMFSKSAYTASLTSYYTFYLIGTFQISVQASQILLLVFLLSQAAGSLIGGHLGDRVGRRAIIWFSILGAVPFTLALPHAGLVGTVVLTIIIGMIMASAFPAILVYGLELMPGNVGLVAGTFYGVTFGLGAVSAALLGVLADLTSMRLVFELCALLPLIGLLTWFLPEAGKRGSAQA